MSSGQTGLSDSVDDGVQDHGYNAYSTNDPQAGDRIDARADLSVTTGDQDEDGGGLEPEDSRNDALVTYGTVSSSAGQEPSSATRVSWRRLPRPVLRIIGTELCERFSYYGLRAILALYIADRLDFGEDTAKSIFSYFSALAYATPLLGGWIADTRLGKYRTIMWLSLVYWLGTATLSLSSINESVWGLFVGLFLIGLGTGGIKPCVSSFGADQFPPHEEQAVQTYFHMFYMAINTGSVASMLLTPVFRHYLGYPVAFGMPWLLLGIAIFVFWQGRTEYIKSPPHGSLLSTVYRVIVDGYTRNRALRKGRREEERGIYIAQPSAQQEPTHWLDAAIPLHGRPLVHDVKALLRVMPIFAVLPVFWTLYDQQGSTWTIQAKLMNRSIFGFYLEPEQLQAINPIMVLALIPLCDRILYPALEKRGIEFRPVRRMSVGMIIAFFAFLVSGFVQMAIDTHEPFTVSVFLQVPQYFLITVAEIFISATGLEFAYSQAPASMKGVIMSLYLCTNAVGDVMAGVVFNAFSFLSDRDLSFLFSGLMFANYFLFLFVARGYKYHQILSDVPAPARDTSKLIDDQDAPAHYDSTTQLHNESP